MTIKFQHGLALALMAFGAGGCQPSFKNSDIEAVKGEIRSNAVAEGFQVSDIQLLKEGPRRLSGFAKVWKVVPMVGRMDITWTCTATMEEGGGRYIWKCAP